MTGLHIREVQELLDFRSDLVNLYSGSQRALHFSMATAAPPPSGRRQAREHAGPSEVLEDARSAGQQKARVLTLSRSKYDNLNRGALVTIAAVAVIGFLKYAELVFVPSIVAVLLALMLEPIVSRLHRIHIPRSVGATIALVVMLGSMGWGAYLLRDRAVSFVESLPPTAEKLRVALKAAREDDEGTVFGKLKQAANEIDETVAVAASDDKPKAPRGVTRVQVEESTFDAGDYLWSGSMQLGALAAEGSVVVFLAYFLLAGGTMYKQKLVRLSGPTLGNRRRMVRALARIRHQMARYLLVQVWTCSLVAVATWLVLQAYGLESAMMWGIVAGILNLVPYFGPALGTGAITVTAFLQFGELPTALEVGLIALLITSIEGLLLKPILMGRCTGINNAAIFLSLVFWGWLWGITGVLLAIPVMMIIKNVCEPFASLRPFGHLLSED